MPQRPASNNSFNRSGISIPLIENLSHDVVISRPVNSGVMSPLRIESMNSPAAPLLCHAAVDQIIERLVEYECELDQPAMKAHGIRRQLSGCLFEKMRRSARRLYALQHNNSFNRSGNSLFFIRQVSRMKATLFALRLNELLCSPRFVSDRFRK